MYKECFCVSVCRWRRKGYSFFKSKAVLLTVVILCIVDCALVLGELTLDLYKVKGKLTCTCSTDTNTIPPPRKKRRKNTQIKLNIPHANQEKPSQR